MRIDEVKNKGLWEKFISSTSPQSIFQSWNWGEVIRKSKARREKDEIKLWRLGLFDTGKLVGIAQIEKVVARRGIFLHVRHGPILKLWNKRDFEYILNYLINLAKENNASFIRISPMIGDSDKNREKFASLGFKDAPIHSLDGEMCLVIDLTQTEEKIIKNMRKTTRYSINKAVKEGVVIEKSKSEDDLQVFIDLYDKTASRHGFVKHSAIVEEFREFNNDDQAMLFKGLYKNKIYAAAMIIFYNHQAIYHHSASIPSKIPINHLLQWEVIKEAKKRGKKLYNLWGIAQKNKPRHPWRGLTIFKRGFSTAVLQYLHAKDLPLTNYYYKTWIIETARRIWKGY